MFFLAVTPVLLIVAVAAWIIGGNIKANAKLDEDKSFGSIVRYIGVSLSLVLLLAIGACSSVATVDNGHIGILKEFGPVVGTTSDGIVFHAPWQQLHEVSIQNEIREYNMSDEGEGSIGSAVSSDTQPITVRLVLDYSLVQAKAVDLFKITNGHYVERKLDPAVPQIVKAITAEYKAVDIAGKREAIRLEIIEKLNAELLHQGIRINTVSLKNFSPTATLMASIEETVKARQDALRAEAQVAIKKAEADQAIETARGVAQSNLVKANAEAQAIRVQGAALRANPEVIRLRAIEKLNPNVQLVVPENSDLILPGSGIFGNK